MGKALAGLLIVTAALALLAASACVLEVPLLSRGVCLAVGLFIGAALPI